MKKWLRDLREQRGYSQAELGEAIGLTGRAILNAEKASEGFPHGLAMLRLLRVLGVVVDAPLAESDGILVRLRALEEKVAELPTAADLQQGLRTVTAAIRRLASEGTGEDRQERPSAD